MNVLIADPDASSARELANWLKSQGWPEPGIAETSDAAVEWVNARGGIDVLVTEAYLPPADGFLLKETLQPYFPGMKTVFLSGGDLSPFADRMQGCGFVSKPAAGQDVDREIRRLFEAPAASQPKGVAADSPQPRAASTTPQAVARASTTPSVSASPKAAQPRARAVAATATPKAAPKAVPAKSTSAPVASAPKASSTKLPSFKEVELFADELVGATLGQYHIEAKIGIGRMGGIYRASQKNMGRQVRFYALDPNRSRDTAQVEKFISNASVKANVNHPNVFAIYEAGESDGIFYYSCEYEPCSTLAQNREAGVILDELHGLRIMKTAADVLGWFARTSTPHEMISERAILLGSGGRCWIANIAAHETSRQFSSQEEMAELSRILLQVIPEGNGAGLGLRALLERVAAGQGPASWPAFYQELDALEPKVAPQDAYKLDAQERAAIRMVEETKKRQRRNMLISSAVSLTLLIAALGSLYFLLNRGKGASVKTFDRMIEIPAGEFVYQDGERINLPAFWIDEHEVTIAQYAEFLEFLKKNPSRAAEFAHPDQPKGKSHVPLDWADQDLPGGVMPGYYTRAQKWGRYKEAPLDVNSPVFGIDWFDAYAYAKWRGRRLPTEQEWEKAARGTEGFAYPWGNDADPKRANTAADLDPNPKKGGNIDGWRRLAPVDAIRSDKSPFGVLGMAGNAAEWTATWAEDPEAPGMKVPVIRGGNWRTPDFKITRRVVKLSELQSDVALGFRTASDTPPQSKP